MSGGTKGGLGAALIALVSKTDMEGEHPIGGIALQQRQAAGIAEMVKIKRGSGIISQYLQHPTGHLTDLAPGLQREAGISGLSDRG